jgi:glycosyltransferase involved in cell wall biosynthesis
VVVVAGAGRDHQRLQAAADGLPVTFLGFQRDVPAFLRTIDLFCLPSRREALPLALLEAMSAGLPCVSTAVGDIAEAAGDDVLLVEPENVAALTDALDRLLTDPVLRAGLGGRARRRAVAEFDGQRMTDRTAAVLAGAARARRRDGAGGAQA